MQIWITKTYRTSTYAMWITTVATKRLILHNLPCNGNSEGVSPTGWEPLVRCLKDNIGEIKTRSKKTKLRETSSQALRKGITIPTIAPRTLTHSCTLPRKMVFSINNSTTKRDLRIFPMGLQLKTTLRIMLLKRSRETLFMGWLF